MLFFLHPTNSTTTQLNTEKPDLQQTTQNSAVRYANGPPEVLSQEPMPSTLNQAEEAQERQHTNSKNSQHQAIMQIVGQNR